MPEYLHMCKNCSKFAAEMEIVENNQNLTLNIY